ncbi:MAG: FAD:protein FMN transferase, partial [Sphingomonadales bacterium]
MGTSWSARIAGGSPDLAAEIQGALDQVVAQMSHWEPGSHLSRFNRSEPGHWQPLPPAFESVLGAALDVAGASGGAFDPAMGALADLWGFGSTGPRPFPDDAAVAAALAVSGARHIEQDGRRARRLAPAALDFSGIAKGHGVDAAANRLLGLGQRDFLIEVGGELRGEGIKSDGQPW